MFVLAKRGELDNKPDNDGVLELVRVCLYEDRYNIQLWTQSCWHMSKILLLNV